MAQNTLPTSPAVDAAGGDAEWEKARRLSLYGFVILALIVIVAPYFLYPIFLMKLMCFAIFASAFNLLLGYGGLLSFGHAAFFGMASYVTGYAARTWGLTPELAILSGVAVSTLLGIVFGAVAIRRQGIYFAMITLALAQMVYFLALQSPSYSGGEDGIQGIPRGHLFGIFDLSKDMTLYAMVAVIFMAALLVIYRIVYSPFGHVLIAIRDNESRATSLGYSALTFKFTAFVLSAALSGLAGATKVIIFQVATLTDVHLGMSAEPVLMTLVGGVGTLFGPLIGAAVIVTMQAYLAHLGAWVTLIQGVIFIFCVILFRRGIVGLFTSSDR